MIRDKGYTVWTPEDITLDLVDRVLAPENLLGLDTETYPIPDTGQFGPEFGLRLVQLGTCSEALVFDPTIPKQFSLLQAILESDHWSFASHTPVDIRNVWAGLGVWIGNRTVDTQLLAKMVNPDERGRANLKSLVEEYFPDGSVLTEAQDALEQVAKNLAPKHHRVGPAFKRFKWGCLKADLNVYLWYAGLDAIFVRRLVHPLLYALYGQRNVILQDHALYAIVQAASVRGIHLDVATCRKILAEYEEKIQEGDETVREILGFPARSPKLADWVDVNVSETQGMDRSPKTGRLTLDSKALPKILALDLPEKVREVLEAREAVASASNTRANLNGFLKAESDGIIHPDVKILQARTARWSITNPALQTLKKSETVE